MATHYYVLDGDPFPLVARRNPETDDGAHGYRGNGNWGPDSLDLYASILHSGDWDRYSYESASLAMEAFDRRHD